MFVSSSSTPDLLFHEDQYACSTQALGLQLSEFDPHSDWSRHPNALKIKFSSYFVSEPLSWAYWTLSSHNFKDIQYLRVRLYSLNIWQTSHSVLGCSLTLGGGVLICLFRVQAPWRQKLYNIPAVPSLEDFKCLVCIHSCFKYIVDELLGHWALG